MSNNSSHQPIDPDLLTRFLSGDTSVQESNQVEAWIAASESNKAYFEQISQLWAKSAEIKELDTIDTTADWQQVRSRMNFAKVEKGNKTIAKERSLLYQFIQIAAICILALGLGWVVYSFIQKADSAEEIVAANSTPSSQITLPDGTKVFLNKNAKVTYNENFGEQTREVQLTGEAFFEVAKNPQKPFIIQTGNTSTEVLGTSFNVYENGKDIVVNVVTGKVALYETASPAKKITMLAGEQGNYQSGTFSKSTHQNLNFLSWKIGILTFKDTPLAKVLEDLNKHYDQHLVLETPELEICTLTSTFSNQTFSEVLEELQLVLPVSVFREGKDIIISGEGCSSNR